MIDLDLCKKEIKKLENKADMMRYMHSCQFHKYEWISKLFSIIIITFSAIVAILAVADPSVFFLDGSYVDFFRNVIAILAILIFLISLGDKIYDINEKAAKHEQAVKVLTDFINECNILRKIEIDSCSQEEIDLKIDSLKTQYSLINQMNPFPTLSDKDFIKAKKKHLIKVDISRKLSENPNEDIGEFVNKKFITRFFKWVKGLLF